MSPEGGTAAEKVVVGYDGGPNGADALAFARRWAPASGDEVLVVTVHPGAAPVGPQHVDAEWAAYEREEADKLLEQARAELGDVPAAFRRIDAGSAARGLHDLVEELRRDCSLVVLGGRRAGARHRTFPGSTADRLLHGSAVPVALVPLAYSEQPGDRLSRVVVGFVDTPEGREALAEAVRITRRLGGTLTVLTVVPDTRVTPAMGEPHVFADEQRADYAAALDTAVARAREAGVSAAGRLVEGDVHGTLAGLGPDAGDLLVLGSRGYGPVRSVLLGGVSSRVVRSAQLPVVTVPRGGR